VYVSDVPDDAWSTGVDNRGRSAHRRTAEAEGSVEGFTDSDDEGEGQEQTVARSSSKAAGKRPIDEEASHREEQAPYARAAP
jgi:hypothetical protein